MTATGFGNINAMVYTLIQAPLQNVGGSAPSIILGIFLCQLFWWFGVHGTSLLAAIWMPVLMPLSIENLAAYNAGQVLPNLFNFDTFTIAMCGGTGATLGLAFALAFLSRSKQYKTMGRLAFVPSIFGVNEPLLFGLPICLNTRMFIPWILVPTGMTALGCLLTSIGIVEPMNGLHLQGIPSLIAMWIYMGPGGGIFNIVVCVVSGVVYWAFFKKIDDEAYEAEQRDSQKPVHESATEVA